MCTMKEVCDQLEMSYETLRFYCDEGLIPNIKRDKNNYRNFDERNIAWIEGLQCLRKCGMSIKDMKQYMHYCLDGVSSIPKRKEMLDYQKQILISKMTQMQESLDYINNKQGYYDDVLSGDVEYTSNLISDLQIADQFVR